MYSSAIKNMYSSAIKNRPKDSKMRAFRIHWYKYAQIHALKHNIVYKTVT